jgi:hypothetical protein
MEWNFVLAIGIPILVVPILVILAQVGRNASVRQEQKDYWNRLPPPQPLPASSLRCPKCSQPMVEGFIPDLNYQAVAMTMWVEGRAQPSFWSGVGAQWERSIPIGSFRCSSCGYLECYARPEFRQP